MTSALGLSNSTTASGTSYYTRDNQGNLVSLRTSTGSYYYLFDGLGSVVGLVDATGIKVNSYSYDPYGEHLTASETVPNPWRYAAGQYDTSTGLTKFGTRYYNPTEASGIAALSYAAGSPGIGAAFGAVATASDALKTASDCLGPRCDSCGQAAGALALGAVTAGAGGGFEAGGAFLWSSVGFTYNFMTTFTGRG